MDNSGDRLKVMIIGNTGSGKSSLGNVILSTGSSGIKEHFQCKGQSKGSVTKEPKIVPTKLLGHDLDIIDTTGFMNKDDLYMPQQLNFVFEKEGVDALLLVVKCQSNPHEISYGDRKSLQYIEKMFGDVFWKYCIIVVTFGQTYYDYVESANFTVQDTFEKEIMTKRLANDKKKFLGPWAANARGGLVLFENKERDPAKRNQMVKDLIERVEKLNNDNEKRKYQQSVEEPKRKWWKYQKRYRKK